MQEKIEALNKKIDELQAKLADNAEVVDAKREATAEQIEDEIAKAKGSVESLKENARLAGERAKSKASSELIKAQMTIEQAKANIADRKEAINRDMLEAYIDDTVEYAASCVELSLMAAEEAKLAMLEAIAAQQEYDEKYGE